MTINELVDKLVNIDNSLNTGDEEPKVLNELALSKIQNDIRDIISDLEQDGIDSNDGFRKVYQGGY